MEDTMHDDTLLGDAWSWDADVDAMLTDIELERLLDRILAD